LDFTIFREAFSRVWNYGSGKMKGGKFSNGSGDGFNIVWMVNVERYPHEILNSGVFEEPKLQIRQ